MKKLCQTCYGTHSVRRELRLANAADPPPAGITPSYVSRSGSGVYYAWAETCPECGPRPRAELIPRKRKRYGRSGY